MTISFFRAAFLRTAFFLFALVSGARAEVKLSAIFGDHMVLQEGMKLPVWGTAQAGEKVTVTVGQATGQTTAGADGKWRVNLPVLPKSNEPVKMTVTGKNAVTFSDVLVGDVWVCSGQSNMEFNLGGGRFGFGGAVHAERALAAANDTKLRLFIVTKKTALDPQAEVADPKPGEEAYTGKWVVSTPEMAGCFSAVGYFFGQDLRAKLKRPIGLIGSYWGGTPAQAWTSIEKLKSDPALAAQVEAYNKIRANLPQREVQAQAETEAFHKRLAEWQTKVLPPYLEALKAWGESFMEAATEGRPLPPMPGPAEPRPAPTAGADGGSMAPANLFNGMIAPLIPYGIKGVIWYQGESNSANPIEYRKLFPDLITDWREHWQEGDFPFLFVQLATYKDGKGRYWAFLREAQLMTLSLPNTGMAVTSDVGDPTDLHPRDKLDVSLRLAGVAMNLVYGSKVEAYGPMYQEMMVRKGAIELSFTHEGGGLVIGSAPWRADRATALPMDRLVGFTVAGDDDKFVPADARIEGHKVIMSSAVVPEPKAVRYGWANLVEGNLYNKEGLPASPFRTDDLPFAPEIGAMGDPPKAAPNSAK